MKTRRTIWTSAIVATVAFAVSVPAQALRCGNRLISEGDHATKLLRYCGEPLYVQSRLAHGVFIGDFGRVSFPGRFGDVLIEEWTYNFGPHKLMRTVRVENGIVRDIRGLGYGYRPH